MIDNQVSQKKAQNITSILLILRQLEKKIPNKYITMIPMKHITLIHHHHRQRIFIKKDVKKLVIFL